MMMNKSSKENNRIEKNKVTSAEIVVHGTIEKPYYEIEYYCVGEKECHIGYSSYDLKFVFKWLDECFELVSSKDSDTLLPSTNRISKDNYYLGIALAVSKRSTCLKRHYGCVIVKDDIIIATGYNGSVRGEENCCDRGTCKRANAERYSCYENCDSVHAEQNALIATSRERLIGSTAYLACEEYGHDKEKSDLWDEEIIGFYEDTNPVPCGICERMLKNAGVIRAVNRRGEICL